MNYDDHWFTGSPTFHEDREHWDTQYLSNELVNKFSNIIPDYERFVGDDDNDWDVAWQFLVEFGGWLYSQEKPARAKKSKIKGFSIYKK